MIELDEEVAQQLTQVSLNSALQVRCGPRNAFAVTSSILTPLMQAFEMGGVYITASRSADEIATAMETVGVPTAPLHFLDLVSSGVLGGTSTSFPNISFVDSPIMLESILLRTLYHLRTTPYERNFVFIDSVNALSPDSCVIDPSLYSWVACGGGTGIQYQWGEAPAAVSNKLSGYTLKLIYNLSLLE